MTLARAVPALVMALLCVAGTGCPATAPTAITASGAPIDTSERSESSGGGQAEGRESKNQIFQLIDGLVAAPATLANGAEKIVGLTIDQSEAEAAARGYRMPTFTVAQAATPAPPAASGAERVVQNALVSVRGYDLRTIPELPSLYTNPDGGFYFKNVPSKIAFFLEANVETRERSFQLLGLTRTEDSGKVTKVKVDIASTMVARELMRMWQISGYRVSFKDLDPRDFNPLLLRVRKKIENGLPAGVFFDPTKVTTPDGGDWDATKDAADSAIVALDKIAAQDEAISREIDRLYLAVNFTITRVRDASRVVIPRPVSISNPPPAASTAPSGTASAAPTATPTPAAFVTVTGTLTGATTKVKMRFQPDLERDEDGKPATTETDATGKWSCELAVGADGGAFYEVFVTDSQGREESRGSFRVFQDGQVAPDFDAPK